MIHTDVSGPHIVSTIDRCTYAVSFIDQVTEYRFVYYIRRKSDVLEALKQFKCDFSPWGRIKRLKSDNGGEYTAARLRGWCRDNNIVQKFTSPDTPEQNGTAERCWGVLKNMARTMMIEAEMAPGFWQRAMSTACYIANRMPTASQPDITPFERLTGERPDNSHFRRFGCLAFPVTPGYKKSVSYTHLRAHET